MSFKAMAFAVEQTVTQTSPQSHLLLIMASYANEQGECYPSIKTMMEKTRLSDKTIRNCLKDLINFGLISDTQKVSQFGSKIYKINLDDCIDTPSKYTTPSNFTGGRKSTSTPLVDLPQPPSKSTSTPLVDLPPNPISKHKINHKNTVSEYIHDENTQENFQTSPQAKTPKTNSSAKKFLTADDLVNLGVNEQVANDYLATRKTKLTQTAINGMVKQAKQANLTLGQAIEIAVENGWQSFKSAWYQNQQQAWLQPTKPNRMAEFAQQASQWGDDFYSQQKSLGASK